VTAEPAETVPSPLGRVRHVVRSRIAEHPALYLPFARRKYPGPSPEVISSETELVIDGYTRSASTFAVYAFQLAQSSPVRLAHHLHAPAQLIAAAKTGKPTLVVIREPKGAVLSQLIREPEVDMKNAMVAYARFHSCLMPYRTSFVIADFQEVTHHFGPVIRRINERFDTTFTEFEDTEANAKLCFDLIKHRPTTIPAWRETLLGFESGTVTLSELRAFQRQMGDELEPAIEEESWIPSAAREHQKEALTELWTHPKLAARRERAELAYQDFLRGSNAV
jgi:hypothetical protein